jgi:FdhD protein
MIRYGVILAGGNSTRMNTDKAELLLSGKSLLSLSIDLILAMELEPVIVTSSKDYGISSDIRVIKDTYKGYGPLGGIHSALKKLNEAILVIACDTPFLGEGIIQGLIKGYSSEHSVIHYKNGDYYEPLPGIYHPDIVETLENAFLKSNRISCRSIFTNLDAVRYQILQRPEEYRGFFFNINKPADFDRIGDFNKQGTSQKATGLRVSFNNKVLNYEEVDDSIVNEIPIEVFLKGRKYSTQMASPDEIEELINGFLISEGIIEKEKIHLSCLSMDNRVIAIYEGEMKEVNEDRLKFYTSSCFGVSTGSEIEIKHLPLVSPEEEITISSISIIEIMDDFQKRASLYKETGGVHDCALADDKSIKYYSDDIGRHNAVDKVLGKSYRKGDNPSKYALFCSGRISSEMMIKALFHNIQIVVSRAAPTFRAIEIARLTGITLVCFTRGNRFTVFSGEKRIK